MTPFPFAPRYGSGQTVTAGASAAVTLNATDLQVCVTNLDSAEIGYIRTGPGDASAADMPVLPGKAIVVSKGDGTIRLAYFSAGTPDLHIMTGNGWLNEA